MAVEVEESQGSQSREVKEIREKVYKAENKVLFTVIDVVEAYHQIAMEQKDVTLTGIITYEGYYEYLNMPFGFVCTPFTFKDL